jgi:glutamyl-tRNA synthetase
MIYRVEDLDAPRVVPGAEAAQMATLRRLGLDWDEGPDVGGSGGPYRQSERGPLYEAALRRLAGAGRLFPCRVSRSELAGLASAPHGLDGPAYPPELRPRDLAPGWFDDPGEIADAAVRFRVDDPPVVFEDLVAGRVREDVSRTVGDFVLRRRDGVHAYQLAVVVDDLAMGVTEVVRGSDLLGSTARQILLIRALGGEPPAYAHVPLVVNDGGEKLSKRDGSAHIDSLLSAGVERDALVGWLAWALGQQETPSPLSARQVAERWAWSRVGQRPLVAPSW